MPGAVHDDGDNDGKKDFGGGGGSGGSDDEEDGLDKSTASNDKAGGHDSHKALSTLQNFEHSIKVFMAWA